MPIDKNTKGTGYTLPVRGVNTPLLSLPVPLSEIISGTNATQKQAPRCSKRKRTASQAEESLRAIILKHPHPAAGPMLRNTKIEPEFRPEFTIDPVSSSSLINAFVQPVASSLPVPLSVTQAACRPESFMMANDLVYFFVPPRCCEQEMDLQALIYPTAPSRSRETYNPGTYSSVDKYFPKSPESFGIPSTPPSPESSKSFLSSSSLSSRWAPGSPQTPPRSPRTGFFQERQAEPRPVLFARVVVTQFTPQKTVMGRLLGA